MAEKRRRFNASEAIARLDDLPSDFHGCYSSNCFQDEPYEKVCGLQEKRNAQRNALSM